MNTKDLNTALATAAAEFDRASPPIGAAARLDRLENDIVTALISAGASLSMAVEGADKSCEIARDDSHAKNEEAFINAVSAARQARHQVSGLAATLCDAGLLDEAKQLREICSDLKYPVVRRTVADLRDLKDSIIPSIQNYITVETIAIATDPAATYEIKLRAVSLGAKHALYAADFTAARRCIELLGDDLDIEVLIARVRLLESMYVARIHSYYAPRIGEVIEEVESYIDDVLAESA